MARIIALLGPTSSGKSALAVQLAQKLECEIINFDVYQMYKDFNIGTGKLSPKQQMGVKHHFLDVINPNQNYTIYQFQKDARKILESDKLFIMTGGSNLYLSSVIFNYVFNQEEKKYDFSNLSNQQLYQELMNLDSISAQKIHPNNRKRVERALTLAKQGKLNNEATFNKNEPLYPTLFIGLEVDRQYLYLLAQKRFDQMIELGLIDEVEYLIKKYPRSCLPFQAIGYLEIANYLDKKISFEEAEYKAKLRTRNYIKKQMTWLRHQYDINYIKMTYNNEAIANQIIQLAKEKKII